MSWLPHSPLLAPALLVLLCGDALSQNWPQWRGPDANGVSPETGIPAKWGPNENIAWKVRIPGRGNSTPILWQDRVFVTSQLGNGVVEASSARYEGPVPPNDSPVTFVIHCYSSKDGRLLWEHKLAAEDAETLLSSSR